MSMVLEVADVPPRRWQEQWWPLGHRRCTNRHRPNFISPSSHLVIIIIFITLCISLKCVFLAALTDDNLSSDESYERGLFPPTFNLASGAHITANATCGENEPETFCKLVEHVRAPQCGVCDAKSANESQRHPITNAIDGTTRWWQSPSLQNGRQFESVSITLDLKQVYQVAYVIVKVANSPRPGNWIIERSLDGIEFKPWQYFAMNDGECLETYGIVPTIGIPRFRSDDEVICTSRYSRLEPLENGEIHMSLVKGRPGVAGPSDKLQEFVAARYVRLRLQKIRTLQGDLMILATYDWERVHKTVTRRVPYGPLQLFYSIKDISIGGQCMCFGHAKDCLDDPHTGRLKCRCVHNTCGDSCEKCCPLYNQKPWRVGTSHEAGICEKCQCNGHADECYYDKGVAARRESINIEGKFDGGGVCVNCSDFTGGFNCERCLDGYFRPLGVTRDASHPCQKCTCDGLGTTGQCVADESHLHRGLSPGDCICRDGFSGAKCAQCAIGYRNYPVCDLCPCNAAGTVNTECEGDCVCKLNVDGVRCDRCKPGHYNLDRNSPRGCTRCYCFDVTDKCTSANLGVQLLSSLDGWLVSDLFGKRVIKPFMEQGILTVANDEMTGYDAYYWLSPTNFTGNKLRSYGGTLHFHAGFVHARGDSAGWPTKGPVLILDGGGFFIAYADDVSRMSNGVVADITLAEYGWYHWSPDVAGHQSTTKLTKGPAVSRGDFMQVLFSLKRILVQAKFHTDQIVGKLRTVSMEIGSETMLSVTRMKGVEKCTCPVGYSGLSCEHCSWGYRRVNETIHGGECRLCDCNGHVATCDSYTGQCLECLNNTTGFHCEHCREGFYGMATRGTPNDCRPCTCPLKDPRNNFSPTCITKMDEPSGNVDYVCTACPVGYEGDKCERCADGYFGNPMIAGDSCRRCECHGHLDVNAVGGCDRQTGQCLKCTGNTVGWHCEQCIDGFFGNPLEEDCRPCKCNSFGSEPATTCNKTTGECTCRRRFEGHSCDRCIEHFGNVEAYCEPCDCHVLGSETNLCSPLSGQCTCKPGVFGFKCDTCRDGYFNFSIAGCEWCNCHLDGSLNGSCHNLNGQCYCQPHVVGQRCDTCQDGYWGLDSPIGCRSCSCNTTGSRSRGCDKQTGQCDCEVGVTGLRCDRCDIGYYGFSERGCRPCEPCTTAGHICHPTTGECVCPPFTEGLTCDRCQPHAWGFNPLQGCKSCDCNADGSLDLQCNITTGKCLCREGYEGDWCSRCHFGYFAFPKCKPCRCDIDGTDPSKCHDSGLCECQENGQCTCKVNKEGKRCKQCKAGTFKLPSSHPKGCLECFCFGKSSRCTQAKYTWTQLAHIGKSSAEQKPRSTLAIVNGLKIIPGTIGDDNFDFPSFLTEPLYWSLPPTLKGDRVLSYTGHLYFHVQSDGGEPFPKAVLDTYPLVQIQGNFRLVLEYFPEIVPLNGRYKVPLHENYWKIRNNHETPVTRELMMVVLQNVQHVFVRATKSTDFVSIRLDSVAVDVAVPAPPLSPVVAVGIESCQCPSQYNGTSCQNPADGYYRKRKKDFLNSKDILDLVGWAEPCQCNNRSETCDKETGVCQKCRNDTTGPNCDECAIGFYGDVFKAPCSQCACPYVNNSFSDFCQLDVFGVLQCLNCKEGYMGSRCERCSEGYYGDPLLPGGRCKPCLCDARGSMGPVCDQLTGQCICLEGLSGRDCSKCVDRHILTQHGCYSCDDGCTGLLLDDLAMMMQQLLSVNLTGVVSAPWEDLFALVERTNAFRKLIESWTSAVDHGEQLLVDFDATFNLQGISSNFLVKSRELKSNALSTAEKTLQTKDRAVLLNQFVLQLSMKIDVTVKRLMDYTRGVKNASINLEAALTEAQNKLDDIRKRDFASKAKTDVEVELRKAQLLLNSTMKLTLDSQNKNNLTKRLKGLDDVFNDANRLIQDTKVQVQETFLLNRTHWRRLQELESELMHLENMSTALMASREGWGELLNEANEEFLEANTHFIDLEDDLDALIEVCYDLGKFVNTYAFLVPEYEARHLDSVRRHADRLMQQAVFFNQSFNSVRNESGHALRAIIVYEEMLQSVSGANESAREASDAADIAHSEALPKQGNSLETKASLSKVKCKDLVQLAEKTRDLSLEGIRQKSKFQLDVVEMIDLTIKKARSGLKMLINDFDKLGPGIKSASELVMVNTSKSLKTSDGVEKKVVAIEGDIVKVVVPKLKALQMASPEGMENLKKNVNNVQNIIGNVTSGISRLEIDRSIAYRRFNTSLERVKGLVLAARQRVSSLTISLSGNGGKCFRSLRPDMRPSATSIISFKYSINTNASDGFLFYLGSDKYLDFMAIEMVDRRMRFVWNAGEDTVAIEHELQIKTNEEKYKYNEMWYQVVAQRIGNLGMLSVQRANGSDTDTDPNVVSNQSAPGHARMDLDHESHFIFGRLPRNMTKSKDLKNKLKGGTGFHGCLFDLQLDLRPVAMWNFIENEGCMPCKQGPSDYEDVSTNEAFFNGEGYAISRLKGRYTQRDDQYSFAFTFKTLDETALLLFAPNNETGYFLMVALEGGHVVFTICGEGKIHRLRSSEKHNTDVWTQVEIRKLGSDAQLKIVSEEKAIHKLINVRVHLRQRHDFYLGGLPPTVDTSLWASWNLSFVPFLLGCLRGVQEDRTTITIVDERIFGVERGCRDRTVNRLAVPGKGYLELKGQPLKSNSTFGFTFQSFKPNGLLLLSTFAGEPTKQPVLKDFYSVALKESRLHLFVGTDESGRKEVTHDEPLDLGGSHHVFITRNGTRVEMFVNDKKVGNLSLKGSSQVSAPTTGGLFIGGIPSDVSSAVQEQAATTVSLSGLIRDAVFDNNLMSFNKPVKFEHVGIGRSLKMKSIAEESVDTTLSPVVTSCKDMQVTIDQSAVQFGDSPNSYVEKRFKSTNGKQEELQILFEFRTRYPNGLLLVLSIAKSNRSYLAIYLNNTDLVLQFIGYRQMGRPLSRSRIAKGRFTELTWQKVVLRKRRKKLILTLPNKARTKSRLTMTLPKNFELGSVYSVGGISRTFNASKVEDSALREPFRGCVRNFRINADQVDLSGGNNVRQCFSTVSDGSYFGGDAYAIYKDTFDVGAKMDIQLEFRTTNTKGTLLSVSERNNSPSLALELHHGRVMMSVKSGDGNVLKAEAPMKNISFNSCDGSWHVIKASYSSGSISLRVDKTSIVDKHDKYLKETKTNSSLYIGGLPDSAPKGSLTSRENLIGCIRNVVVNDKRPDWIDWPNLHHVLLNSCPIS